MRDIFHVPVRRHRASRVPFVAGVQVTCIDTEEQVAAHTEDLTFFGCFIETITPFVAGTKVAVRISHNGSIVLAHGKVVHSQQDTGMGIRFTSVEPASVSILDAWLTESGD